MIKCLRGGYGNDLHLDSTKPLTCCSMQTEMPTRQSTPFRRPVIFKACSHADEKKLSEVCVQHCGLTRRQREETSWSPIPAQLASLYNFTCGEIVTPCPPCAHAYGSPLCVLCRPLEDHEKICSQSCLRPSGTIYCRPVLCDKLHDSGFRHNVTTSTAPQLWPPAPSSPVLAAMFLDLSAIAARALSSDGT